MKVTVPLIYLTFPAIILAETITFFKFEETRTITGLSVPTGSYAYSALGVGSDGATTYIQEYVYSEYLEWSESRYISDGKVVMTSPPTSTVTRPPSTTSQLFVADATHYFYSASLGFGGLGVGYLLENCDLDGKGGIGCVATGWRSGKPFITTSLTGHAVPAYTFITTDDKADGNTQHSSATKNGLQFLVAVVVVSAGVSLGFAMAI